MTNGDTLRTALAELADDWTGTGSGTADVISRELRRLLAAHPAELVPDTRREDIINAINAAHWEVFEASDGNRSIRPLEPDSGDLADAVLAALPAPPVDEAEVRERIAQDIESSILPNDDSPTAHWLRARAANIARGATR